MDLALVWNKDSNLSCEAVITVSKPSQTVAASFQKHYVTFLRALNRPQHLLVVIPVVLPCAASCL